MSGLLAPMPLQYSPDEPDSIAAFLREGMTTVLADDLTQGEPAVVRLFDRMVAPYGREVLACRFAFQPEPLQLPFSSWADVASAFRDDEEGAFASDFYFETSSGGAFGYSSRQTSISIVTAKVELLSASEVEQWDRAFETTINSVGFGAAGKVYVQTLLAQFPEPRRSRLLTALRPRSD
jgi:hypothetical protein